MEIKVAPHVVFNMLCRISPSIILTLISFHLRILLKLTIKSQRMIGCNKQESLSVEGASSAYRSGTVNSKSFVGKVLFRIKWKFELINAL